MERARELAGESHRTARQTLAEAVGRAAIGDAAERDRAARGRATGELEQIVDFIYRRTS
jgi:hypothetical protein